MLIILFCSVFLNAIHHDVRSLFHVTICYWRRIAFEPHERGDGFFPIEGVRKQIGAGNWRIPWFVAVNQKLIRIAEPSAKM